MEVQKKQINNENMYQNNEVIEFVNVNQDPNLKNEKEIVRGRKQQITITMDPSLIHKIDKIAHENGQSRAAFISMACINILNNGLKIQGKK